MMSVMAFLVTGAVALTAVAQDGDPRVPSEGQSVALDLVADGLTAPVAMANPGDGSGRQFVVDQAGMIRVIAADGTLQPEPFLDLRDRMVDLTPSFDERGLLGLAFHPDYADNGRFFVYYSAPLREDGPENFNHTSHVAEFHVSADPDRADPDSERIVLQIDEPQFNHNSGALAFGPDGLLYIAVGDGGGAHDLGVGHTPDIGNGQDRTNLLGNILRVDVDGGEPYAIPSDNPFVGREGRDEIFAYGLRNPYRMSFDSELGLLASDAGQGRREEVSRIEAGGNYGWNLKEGTDCFDPTSPFAPPEECSDTGPFGQPLIDPVAEYHNRRSHDDGVGIAIIGGHVYRGEELPGLAGKYVFGDWSQSFTEPGGTLLAATPSDEGLWPLEELQVAGRPEGRLGHFVLGFGRDEAGEMYVLTTDEGGPTGQTGRVYQLVSPEQCVDLIAGRDETAGEVCVSNDSHDLSVTYTTTGDWELDGTRLHVADDAADIPQSRPGNPKPGQFDHASAHEPAVTTVTHTIPLADLGAEPDDELAVAAKAEVRGPDGRTEGAWADGDRFVDRGNWATYFAYVVR